MSSQVSQVLILQLVVLAGRRQPRAASKPPMAGITLGIPISWIPSFRNLDRNAPGSRGACALPVINWEGVFAITENLTFQTLENRV